MMAAAYAIGNTTTRTGPNEATADHEYARFQWDPAPQCVALVGEYFPTFAGLSSEHGS